MNLKTIIAPIRDEFRLFEKAFAGEFSKMDPALGKMAAQLNSIGGKRCRPIFVLLSAKAAGEVKPVHIDLGVTMEMVHTATLLHDDVLDAAEMRREKETVNARWGNQQSILLGDYLFSQAFFLSTKLDGAEFSGELARITNRVSLGEMMQTRERFNYDLAEPDYFEIIENKTAALFEASCRMGARFSGGIDHEEAMAVYGKKIGTAFQVVDDYLDICGTEDVVGKTLGTDVDQGKVTLPVIHALANASPGNREKILDSLGSNGSPVDGEALRRLLGETGSIEYALDKAKALAGEASSSLEGLPAGAARDSLLAATAFVVNRKK